MEKTVTEFKVGNAIVRIHPGNKSKEERRAIAEDAARKLYRALQKANKNKTI